MVCDPHKGFSVVNEAEVDAFLELPCFLHDSTILFFWYGCEENIILYQVAFKVFLSFVICNFTTMYLGFFLFILFVIYWLPLLILLNLCISSILEISWSFFLQILQFLHSIFFFRIINGCILKFFILFSITFDLYINFYLLFSLYGILDILSDISSSLPILFSLTFNLQSKPSIFFFNNYIFYAQNFFLFSFFQVGRIFLIIP